MKISSWLSGIIGLLFLGSSHFAHSVSLKVSTKTPLKLYVLNCGYVQANDLSLFNPLIKKDTKKQLSNACYLIQHPKATLLWDTGLSDDLLLKKEGEKVLGGAFHMSIIKTLASQLKSIGLTPDDISYVAFSHMHNDHTGNAKLFTKSKWLIQEAEYNMAMSDKAQSYGYAPQDYQKVKANVVKLKGAYDVFGDGSAILIPTPGHSAGHQSLLVGLSKTGPVMIAGDLYHFQENRETYSIPVWNSKKETIHSFVRIDEIIDQNKATLWIQHDKPLFDSQKHAPKFYE